MRTVSPIRKTGAVFPQWPTAPVQSVAYPSEPVAQMGSIKMPVVHTAMPFQQPSVVHHVQPQTMVMVQPVQEPPVVVHHVQDQTHLHWLAQEEKLRAAADMQACNEISQLRGEIGVERQEKQRLESLLNEEIASLKNFISQVRSETSSALLSEQSRHDQVSGKLRSDIASLSDRVSALEAGPQETEIQRRVRGIEANGNIRVNLHTGRVDVIRAIAFQQRRTTDAPTAELANPEVASFIFDDIAVIAQLFDHQITIEGHTRGGESDFWQALADDRARLVGSALVDRGVSQHRIGTVGLPGKLGLNKVAVVVLIQDAHS